MKTLLILRHAKSSWKDAQVADHDRPLNQRGKQDAPRVGERMRSANLLPERIISSTAKRARKTAAKVAQHCGYQGTIDLRDTLYLAPPDAYIELLRQVDESVSRVLVVGHNPGLEQLLALLTGHCVPLPTAALAHVELDLAQWHHMNSQTRGALLDLWTPEDWQPEDPT